ncbi:MAG: SDR family NAD(P)-dependent oxidoreductase [Verrucomicrobiota bacterium]|jgi:NADP-dependent 3-hydroxy acid dehydrogenase YdfG
MSDSSPRTWLVTGASSGFGRALTEAIIACGDVVVATARKPEAIEDLASRAPDQCHVLPLDVTQSGAPAAVVRDALAHVPSIDVLVNNAGRGLLGAVEECSEADARACMELNFFAQLAMIQAILPHFRGRRSGHVIQMGAAAAISNYAGFGIYGAAKAATSSLVEALAQEVRPMGIKVTLVEPGPFRTDFIGRSMARAAVSLPEYEPTAGRFAQYLGKIDGHQPGNPHLAASLIVRMVLSGKPPMRLVLGKYAIDKTRRTFAARERELVQHEVEGAATDGP